MSYASLLSSLHALPSPALPGGVMLHIRVSYQWTQKPCLAGGSNLVEPTSSAIVPGLRAFMVSGIIAAGKEQYGCGALGSKNIKN